MKWSEPEYSQEQVDSAGRVLIAPDANECDLVDALEIVNNWRSCHGYPLNTFQAYLRKQTRSVDQKGLVAQRIKRMPAITGKLHRFHWLKLSQMQDVGGCRTVVRSVRAVRRLVRAYKECSIKHRLIDSDDYIIQPKASGYRGYHLIYCYNSDKVPTYNDLKVELQIRSNLQHIWATAVETVGTFTQQGLKSSQGEHEWLRFFALMGSEMALREKTQLVPGTPTDVQKLRNELRGLATELEVAPKLEAFGVAMDIMTGPALKGARYYLLKIYDNARRLQVTGFGSGRIEEAYDAYTAAEAELRRQPGSDAVLVSVESLSGLRRAYPNYFMDTRRFLAAVNRATS